MFVIKCSKVHTLYTIFNIEINLFDNDLFEFGSQRGWIKKDTYTHTCNKKKLGLYIKYIHTINYASHHRNMSV